ncbi:MAG: GNAT family N-acetyltransferase [Chloroflexi bacterium]|nr:MAG: GNAT family N-acetyltransferase [Chloroflexota bacterium]
MLNRVTVRPILADELPKVARLRAVGFGGDERRVLQRLKQQPRYNYSHIIIAEYEGEAIGTATAFPVDMWLSGVPVKVGAVAGVTVLPEFRRKGIAAKMMEFLIVRMFAEGQAMSALFPFSHKYYRQFGYETVGDVHAYRINPQNLTVFPEGHKVRPYQPDDLPMMRVIHKAQLTWRNGWFTRPNEWWAWLVNRWPDIMVYDNDGMIEGYYFYNITTTDRGERVLHLLEFMATEDEAYRGLIGYLAAQNEADVIEYMAPPDTLLRHALRQPYADEAVTRQWVFKDLCHVTPGMMARIINLPAALTARFYTRGLSGERTLKVHDRFIPTNEEPLVFRIVDGRAETRPADNGKRPDIETDIGTFTQVLCGYITPTDARRLGRFHADENTCSWLEKAITDTPLYVPAGDWF